MTCIVMHGDGSTVWAAADDGVVYGNLRLGRMTKLRTFDLGGAKALIGGAGDAAPIQSVLEHFDVPGFGERDFPYSWMTRKFAPAVMESMSDRGMKDSAWELVVGIRGKAYHVDQSGAVIEMLDGDPIIAGCGAEAALGAWHALQGAGVADISGHAARCVSASMKVRWDVYGAILSLSVSS